MSARPGRSSDVASAEPVLRVRRVRLLEHPGVQQDRCDVAAGVDVGEVVRVQYDSVRRLWLRATSSLDSE